MVYRGAKPREAKKLFTKSESTSESKWRRHRNKKRIWRRAVRKFEMQLQRDLKHAIELPANALPV